VLGRKVTTMRASLVSLLLAASLPCSFAACGSSSDDAGAPAQPAPSSSLPAQPVDPGPYAPLPASAIVEEGAVKIRREVLVIDGAKAPDNPQVKSGGATPAEYQRVRVVRYRMETGTGQPAPARAIAVLMPGFLGGAGSFDPLARAIVRRSTPDAPLEAWAIDRRSNLLEDHHGLDVAEHYRDASKASAYYLEGAEVEGKTFAGFAPQQAYIAEWGLATTIGDLRAAIALVPQAERRGRVTLVGHSLGASIAEEYAAWDFDGTPGFSELASLVLVDGVSGSEGDAAPPRTQEQYEKGGDPAPGGFGATPGLEAVRKSTRYFTLPILGSKVYPVASILGMRALFAPDDIVDDVDRDNLMQTLLSLGKMPKVTNRAAMGLSFDASTNALSFAAVKCGEAEGGPMEPYTSAFGPTLVHPADPTATYRWVDHDKTSPRENTSLDTLARVWFEGPGLDFAEWYFPQRLTIDVPLAATLSLTDADWPAATYGMRAFHGAALDLPIFAHAAGLMGGDTSRFDRLRSLVSAVPIGTDRPASGEPRTSDRAFRTLGSPDFSHIDPLLGADDPGSPVGAWYDALAGWMLQNAPPGGASVPSPP
jgi:pimeloyl-ACP methyl ester carboxylesterase